MGTAVIVGILVICCFVGVRSTIKRVAHGCCGSGGDAVQRIKPADTDLTHYPYTYRIEVEGMTCGECRKRVENAFNAMDGVYAVVNLKKKLAEIHTKQELPEDEIRRTIYRVGYEPGRVLE